MFRIRRIFDDVVPANRYALEPTWIFDLVSPSSFSESFINSVHDPGYVRYFKRVCSNVEPDTPFYPYVFPIRNRARPLMELPVRSRYYCIDTLPRGAGRRVQQPVHRIKHEKLFQWLIGRN